MTQYREASLTISNRFRKVLTTPSRDRPVLDAFSTSLEAIADLAMKDELLAAVPFASVAFKVVKASDSYRDRIFAAKLQAFIAEVETLLPEERTELARKLTADDEGRRAGETLLLVLDKLTDLDKPALLCHLLKSFGIGRITGAELRRLATVIDGAFSDDLASFLDETPEELQKESIALHRENLVSVGLTRTIAGDTWQDIGNTRYRATDLGMLLHELLCLPE